MDSKADIEFSRHLRILARCAGLLIGGGYVLLVLLEYGAPQGRISARASDWNASLLFLAIFVGLLVSRRWELPGAALSLAGIIGFSLYVPFFASPVLWVLLIPVLLYLLDWMFHHRGRRASRPLTGGK